MPRSAEFDTDSVLCAAMEKFRHNGFAGTSIKALEQATGLSSGSLYNSFGDKDAIFTRALAHYIDVVAVGRISQHLDDKPPLEGLLSYFLSLLEEPGGGSSGCLLTNSAVEFGSGDTVARPGVQAGLRLQEAALHDAVRRLLPTATDTAERAQKLLALYQGVLVLVRFGHPKEALRAMILNELNQLGDNCND